jgi:hypothetical protein
MFAMRGFDGVKVAEVADRVGVSARAQVVQALKQARSAWTEVRRRQTRS